MKEISVVVPIYNTEKYIINFIKSVINQTYTDFELILVNDGTKDNSIALAEELLKDSKIEYIIINKENGGQSTARNAGINIAKGKWIVTPDSDDVLQKDYLEVMCRKTQDKDVDVIICDLANVTDDNINQETNRTGNFEIKSGKEFFINFIMHKISIGPVSLMIKKELIDTIGLRYNENSRYSEEFIFITALLYNANMVVHVKERLYNYCLRKGSVSTGANIDKIVNGYNEIVKASSVYCDKNDYACKIYNNYAHQRWMLATARFTSSNLSFKNYKVLMERLDAKKNIKELLRFPNIKIKIAAIVFCLSIRLFYMISK